MTEEWTVERTSPGPVHEIREDGALAVRGQAGWDIACPKHHRLRVYAVNFTSLPAKVAVGCPECKRGYLLPSI